MNSSERKSSLLKYMDVSGKKVVVVGLARSGVAAARLLAAAGARVVANDRKTAAELAADLAELSGLPAVKVITGSNPPELVDSETVLVVKNPGIPGCLPVFARAKQLGIPVIPEVELAFWAIDAPIIGITGTNGKTTTTVLTGEILKTAGRRTHVAGNIGLPLSAAALDILPGDIVVAELSSFQLEDIVHFRPAISVILNITPDHIDRHGTMAAYKAAKARIFSNQGPGDAVILNADDQKTFDLHHHPRARVYLFSRRREVPRGAFLERGQIMLRDGGEKITVCAVREVAIPGGHNLENALAAGIATWLAGAPPWDIAATLRKFKGVPHRLEEVATINGVTFINDSKGTNPDACVKALESYRQPKILIAGGYDKGGSFDNLALEIKKHAAWVVLLGQVKDRLAGALQAVGFTAFEPASGLADAVHKAYRAARPGDIVLLSPACASWDMFANFEERGELFKQVVRNLAGEGRTDEGIS